MPKLRIKAYPDYRGTTVKLTFRISNNIVHTFVCLKVYFIITSVKNGQQKRYLEWFQRQYLNTAESQTLRADLIRYICVVVHPTNEQLNAGLVPRWALCGWLINSCTNQIEAANLKLALFFDWLMYDAKRDNIMLIEPAILLMYNPVRPTGGFNASSISLTNQLFDFLCRISTNYHWPLKDQILNGNKKV